MNLVKAMILTHKDNLAGNLHPAIKQAVAWIQAEGIKKPAGKHEIDGDKMFADVQEIETSPREDRRYEAHQQYVDVQYCVAGGERIEWSFAETLEPQDEYDSDKDVIHYNKTADPVTSILMTPGTIAIFFPGDAHMVKISDDKHDSINKVVVKVHVDLLKQAT